MPTLEQKRVLKNRLAKARRATKKAGSLEAERNMPEARTLLKTIQAKKWLVLSGERGDHNVYYHGNNKRRAEQIMTHLVHRLLINTPRMKLADIVRGLKEDTSVRDAAKVVVEAFTD